MDNKTTIKKIGLLSCISTAVGAIVGSGIFGALPEGINRVGAGVLPALLVAVIYVIFTMFPNVFASSVIPTTGSFFLYSTKLIHPFFGLWVTLQGLLQPVLIAMYAVAFAEYFVVLFPALAGYKMLISIVLLLFFAVLAWLGNHTFASVTNIMVVVMLLAIAAYVFIGIPNIDLEKIAFGDVLRSGTSLTAFAATIGLFSTTLSGAHNISQIADDIKNPQRNIPLTLILAPIIVCIIYALMTVVTLSVKPEGELANLAEVGERFLSPGLLTFFIIGGPLCGILTSIVPVIMMSCALIQTSAENGVFPKELAKRNKYGVPGPILVFVIVFSAILVSTGSSFGELMSLFSFVNTACAIPTCLVPFFLRRRYPNACAHAGLKLNINLVYALSIFSLIASIYLAITMFITLELISWIIVGVVVLGTAIYFFSRVAYIKSKGGDLLQELRAPYEPWEKRERDCQAM
ncbi:MAG: APC family permease [Clostridiales bacterium]|nr:APC family permease [Clostridiales bacterium]